LADVVFVGVVAQAAILLAFSVERDEFALAFFAVVFRRAFETLGVGAGDTGSGVDFLEESGLTFIDANEGVGGEEGIHTLFASLGGVGFAFLTMGVYTLDTFGFGLVRHPVGRTSFHALSVVNKVPFRAEIADGSHL